MKNNFDHIAWFYDPLKKLIYGNATTKAERSLCKDIPCHTTVLIIGGGTGEVLECLQTGVKVDFVDISPKMIHRAQKRKTRAAVNFIIGSIQDTPLDRYDIIVTNFFLDLFEKDELVETIEKLSQFKPKQWIVTDFVAPKRTGLSQLLEWTMYRFFKITTGISAHKLEDFDSSMKEAHLSLHSEQHFYFGFIKSTLWTPIHKK